MNDADFADRSPGEAMLEDRSHLPLDGLEIEDDGESFAALRALHRADKEALFAAFEVLLRRWVVERIFAWLGRCRRLAKDWEKSIASSEAWINVVHIRLTTMKFCTKSNSGAH